MSFIKILGVALSRGRATIRYPLEPPLITPYFRGRIEIDPSKCVGCGACARICPPKAIEIVEQGDKLAIRYFVGRCIFCAMCFDVCPQSAIEVTKDFELASLTLEDLYDEVVHSRRRCSVCGEPYLTTKLVDRVLQSIAPELRERLEMCPRCRRESVMKVIARARIRYAEPVEGG